MCYEPVQIEIEPDCIKITSFPGIDRSISLDTIEKGERFKSKMYRNRRLGEFLKELDLTEGRSTGIPTIQEGLQRNGSPRATFETDEDRRVLWVTIPIQPDYFESLDSLDSLDSSDTNQNDISSKQDINDKEIQLLELLEQ